jgi:hypothetical protein
MKIDKHTKVKTINEGGCYYKQGTQIFDGTNNELMCVATDTINAKLIMTALNLANKITMKGNK